MEASAEGEGAGEVGPVAHAFTRARPARDLRDRASSISTRPNATSPAPNRVCTAESAPVRAIWLPAEFEGSVATGTAADPFSTETTTTESEEAATVSEPSEAVTRQR